jgi:hypothetical protein
MHATTLMLAGRAPAPEPEPAPKPKPKGPPKPRRAPSTNIVYKVGGGVCVNAVELALIIGLARTIHIYVYMWCVYSICCREITMYTVIHCVYTVLANPT